MTGNPLVDEWLQKAEDDRTAALHLHAATPQLADQIGFHAQQCAEKYLQAYLIAQGEMPEHTHDLERLCACCEVHAADFATLRPGLPALTNFAVGYRYPSLSATPAEAAQALTDAEAVRALVRAKLGLPHS
jgi:HEPN domain-containing protein